MTWLTRFSMKNVTAVMIMMLLLVFGGIFSASSLKMEMMPDISIPVVMVSTQYTAPPLDVMEDVTEPIEKALAGVDGLKNITSTSNDNFSNVVVELETGVDSDEAKDDVQELINDVNLPENAGKPSVSTISFNSMPSFYLAIYGEGMNQSELDRIFADDIEPTLESVKGAARVDSVGDQEATIKIKLDANALQQYGMTTADVMPLIKSKLSEGPIGTAKIKGSQEMVKVTGKIDSIYMLENMNLTMPTGDTVRLNQIAKVESVSESDFKARLNNQSAISVNLVKTKNTNAVDFSADIQKHIEEWQHKYPNIKFQKIFDTADSVLDSVYGMLKEGIMGAVLASVMILLFLRNLRMTLIVLVSIPLSILITLLVMSTLDVSLNVMTLGGMTIAIGRVVDDSIVVIENIYSQLHKTHERGESVIFEATKQVASAITSSTITTVGVFAPIALVSGMIGEVFRPFAITLATALMASLLVALTVIPMLAKLLVLTDKKKHKESDDLGKVSVVYERALKWSLQHRWKSISIAVVAFILSLALVLPQLAVAFMPESETEKQMNFTISLPKETSKELTDAKLKELETIMRESKDPKGQPMFTYIETLIGYEQSISNFDGDQFYAYKAMMFTEVTKDTDAQKVVLDYKNKFEYELPKGSEVTGSLMSSGGTGGSDFSYLLKGDDLRAMEETASKMKEKMREFPELYDIDDSLSEKKQEVDISVDEEKARMYGLSAGQVMQAAAGWLAETSLGEIKFNNTDYKTKVMLDEKFKDNVQRISNLSIKSGTGSWIAIRDIATVREVDAATSISRDNQTPTVTLTAAIDSKNKGGISTKVQAELDKIELPAGVFTQVKGVSEDIQESFSQMGVAMAAAILIVYLVLVLAFGNGSAPFAILFSLPLAVIGGLIGLLVASEPLSVTSLIGFMMLIGIVVTNAIVLIDRVQQLREHGHDIREALIEAGLTRLRPIIMTAGATVFALLPLALGASEGAIISKGLGVVVIGGLTTSTVLTLFIVPIVYEMVERFKARFSRKGKKNNDVDGTASASV